GLAVAIVSVRHVTGCGRRALAPAFAGRDQIAFIIVGRKDTCRIRSARKPTCEARGDQRGQDTSFHVLPPCFGGLQSYATQTRTIARRWISDLRQREQCRCFFRDATPLRWTARA